MNLETAKKHKNKRILSLGFVLKGKCILLAMKKIRFGQGWWNGFGGGVEKGESIEEGLIREAKEEGNIQPTKLVHVGINWFKFVDNPTILEVHVFQILDYRGRPTESDEMGPMQWFPLDAIPYTEMWPTDEHFLPFLLRGELFEGYFLLSKDKKLLSYEVVPL